MSVGIGLDVGVCTDRTSHARTIHLNAAAESQHIQLELLALESIWQAHTLKMRRREGCLRRLFSVLAADIIFMRGL